MKSWQVLLDFANELLTQDTSGALPLGARGVYTLAGCTQGKEADPSAIALADSSVPDRKAIDWA
jgi:hypothetical protein